jgi:pimeloyl-ACP methyl ester carboxylesterase
MGDRDAFQVVAVDLSGAGGSTWPRTRPNRSLRWCGRLVKVPGGSHALDHADPGELATITRSPLEACT